MNENLAYCSYDDNGVVFNFDTASFEIFTKNQYRCIKNAKVTKLFYKNTEINPAEFKKSSHAQGRGRFGVNSLIVTYTREAEIVPSYTLKFSVDYEGVIVEFSSDPECTAHISGDMMWGANMKDHTFPMSSIENSCHLRSAIGPATSTIDNILFDRLSDSAVSVTGGKSFRMRYDWNKEVYGFTVTTGIKTGEHKFHVTFPENIMANQYHFKYGSINKKGVFKKPPAGWMTWYSVGFDASEKTVLENAEWQAKHLKPFGADTVWVDWEWHHPDYAGIVKDGTSSLSPDKNKYPNGLGFVADKIKELGLVPALWIGFTNDSGENDYIKENPEIVLNDKTSWCGSYFYDFSHPKYLNEFLPKALGQVRDWGYQAIKYDTICDGIINQENLHMKTYDPSLTSRDTFRAMIKKTRECMGEDCYMLACGPTHAGILWAGDTFDAARMGADIFEWDEFIEEGIIATMRYYPIHNVVLYNDPDNVIISEKYNTYSQAASRIYFVTMLGLPLTFGDVFAELPESRVDLIKRCLPTMDIHPMDTKNHTCDKRFLATNLNIEKPYESYNVVSMLNLLKEKKDYEVRLTDLFLDEGEYHLYDFTDKKYLGYTDAKIALTLGACESHIIAVRKKLDRPQLISTSRHITQGAAEIENMVWSDEELTLTITSSLVANDPYTVTVYAPKGYAPADESLKAVSADEGIYEYTLNPEESKAYEIKLTFVKE